MWYTVPTLHNTVSAVGKESFMKRQQEEFTALYCRLSQDEELRELWKDCPGQKKISLPTKLYYEKIINSAKNDMQETFFSMIDKKNSTETK